MFVIGIVSISTSYTINVIFNNVFVVFCPPYTFSGLPNPAKREHRFSDSPESSDARKYPRTTSPDVPSDDLPGHWEWPEAGEIYENVSYIHEDLYLGSGGFYDGGIGEEGAVHSGDIDERGSDPDIYGGRDDVVGSVSGYGDNDIFGVLGGGAGGHLTSSLAGALSGAGVDHPSAGAASSGAGAVPSSAGAAPSSAGVAPSSPSVAPSGADAASPGAGAVSSSLGAAPSGAGAAPSSPGAAPSGASAAASATGFSLASLGVDPVPLFPPFTQLDTTQFDDSQLELFMELALRCEFTDPNPDLGASHGGLMSTEDKANALYTSSIATLGMDASVNNSVHISGQQLTEHSLENHPSSERCDNCNCCGCPAGTL